MSSEGMNRYTSKHSIKKEKKVRQKECNLHSTQKFYSGIDLIGIKERNINEN